ncbi:MAG: hypothetical protein ABH867_03390 [Patescibacteria group bacterium]|nr:hypothetical protein [Patescibacteria group bacterium]
MFKKISVAIIIAIAAFSAKLPTALASEQDPTDSAITQEKQEEIIEEVQKKVKEKLDAILVSRNKKGWIGVVGEKGELSFEIESNGQNRTVTIASDVVIIDQNRKTIDFENLKSGERVVAMGYEQVDGTLEAKRIVSVPEPEERKTEVFFGLITDKSEESEIISIGGAEGKEYELILTAKTIVQRKADLKNTKLKYEDIKPDQKIIAVATPARSNGSTFNVSRILIISKTPTEEPSQEPATGN